MGPLEPNGQRRQGRKAPKGRREALADVPLPVQPAPRWQRQTQPTLRRALTDQLRMMNGSRQCRLKLLNGVLHVESKLTVDGRVELDHMLGKERTGLSQEAEDRAIPCRNPSFRLSADPGAAPWLGSYPGPTPPIGYLPRRRSPNMSRRSRR
jgi:hypothetical protein